MIQTLTNVYSTFRCVCQDYYFGRRCENKINLCENETCSGNGVCQVNEANNSISCMCYGTDSFTGLKCETKTSKQIMHETTVKITTIVAIISVILFYAFVLLMDYHTYFVLKKPFVNMKAFNKMLKGVKTKEKGKQVKNAKIKPSKNGLEKEMPKQKSSLKKQVKEAEKTPVKRVRFESNKVFPAQS